MSIDDRAMLEQERGTLERFLGELAEGDVLERVQLQHRLAEIEARLAELPPAATPRAKPLSIAFRGEPVEGARAIDAHFAARAVEAFVSAADTITAAVVTGDLKASGPLPGRVERPLRIVHTVAGSFGFELELPPPPVDDAVQSSLFPAVDHPDPHSEAISKLLALLGEAMTDHEEAISDLVAEIHPRAAAKVRAFAKVLLDHRAFFAVSFQDQTVRLDEESQVQRVLDALKDEDISEERETLQGELLGVLPVSRDFEVRLESGAVLRGKLDRTLDDIPALRAQYEGHPARFHCRVVRVRTTRRYLLTAAEPLGQPTRAGDDTESTEPGP